MSMSQRVKESILLIVMKNKDYFNSMQKNQHGSKQATPHQEGIL